MNVYLFLLIGGVRCSNRTIYLGLYYDDWMGEFFPVVFSCGEFDFQVL